MRSLLYKNLPSFSTVLLMFSNPMVLSAQPALCEAGIPDLLTGSETLLTDWTEMVHGTNWSIVMWGFVTQEVCLKSSAPHCPIL